VDRVGPASDAPCLSSTTVARLSLSSDSPEDSLLGLCSKDPTMAVMMQTMPAMNGQNGDVTMALVETGPRFTTGLILPPPEIKCTSARLCARTTGSRTRSRD
jgi:hypothetical protein